MAGRVMTVRLDERTRRRVSRVARRRKQPVSAAVREAIDAWLEQHEGGTRVFELIADLAGCVKGPRNLSVGGGRKVAALLRKRRRGRAR